MLSGVYNFIFRCIELAIRNVGTNGVVEEGNFLTYQRNVGVQALERCIPDIHAVNRNGAFINVMKAGNKV